VITNAQGWTQWTGRAVVLARDNIDTDQIYPGRFLSLTDRTEMAPAFFADWRFAADGSLRGDSPFADGQSVLVAGENFGCGSSREHAVWVMRDFGIRVVLARSFAPIFKQNAIANGIAPIEISAADYKIFAANTQTKLEITVDLAMGQGLIFSILPLNLWIFNFKLDAFDVYCLRTGTDPLGFLLSLSEKSDSFSKNQNTSHPLEVYFSKGDSP
jgi:3-isopropylmalate/(R)-2-methylmalate dehydratase small subunit